MTTVTKTLTVRTPQDFAFNFFTAHFGQWWPVATHKIGKEDAEAAIIEPRAGGRWFERGVNGTECQWGHVIAWEPPSRVVLAWQLNMEWQFDPSLITEVEVRFTAEGAESTRVDFSHKLDAFGEAAAGIMKKQLEQPGAWSDLLQSYASAAEAELTKSLQRT
jgi:hypothetical protein